MFSKLGKIGSLFVSGVLASICATAQADNINTSGVVCRNYNAADVLDIDYVPNGVQNINAASRQVICSMPRSPFSSTTVPQFFYIDGHNNAGTTTNCRLITYTFGGVMMLWPPFTEPASGASPDWDHLVTLPPGTLGTYDYADVLCTIPGQRQGTIYGVTAPQL